MHDVRPLTVVTEMSRCVQLEFAAENQVGYGRHGEVVIKEKAQKTLHKYNLPWKEVVYKVIWSENFPHGVNTASVIAAYATICKYDSVFVQEVHVILHDKTTSTTLVLSTDGRKLLDSWHHEGILLTCFDEQFVYAVEKAEGGYEIAIVNVKKGRSETKLQPFTAKPTWSHPYLSLCKSVFLKRIVVTSTDHTLDIYYESGGR